MGTAFSTSPHDEKIGVIAKHTVREGARTVPNGLVRAAQGRQVPGLLCPCDYPVDASDR